MSVTPRARVRLVRPQTESSLTICLPRLRPLRVPPGADQEERARRELQRVARFLSKKYPGWRLCDGSPPAV
jgi:hypothetical protein